MKTAVLLVLAISACGIASADFSYMSTRKTTGGMMAAMAGNAANGVTKVYFKGQKMKTEDRDNATLIDFDAQTITIINNTQKTVQVRNFGDTAGAASGPGLTIDAKETGQRKTVNGFDARELLLTMDFDAPAAGGMAAGMGKMHVEVDMWISSAVPGGGEMRAFYQKNSTRFPWAAIGGNNASMQSALAEVQKKIASMDGVAVEQIISLKPAGGSAAMTGMPAMPPQLTPAQQAQMAQARAQLEALQKQGGPAAAMAAQALARMGAGPGATPGGAAPAGNPTSLLEMTVDSSDFSTSPVPDSVFVLPADYRRITQ